MNCAVGSCGIVQLSIVCTQKGCQALVPEIESRLQAKLQWLIGLFDFKGKSRTPALLECLAVRVHNQQTFAAVMAEALWHTCATKILKCTGTCTTD